LTLVHKNDTVRKATQTSFFETSLQENIMQALIYGIIFAIAIAFDVGLGITAKESSAIDAATVQGFTDIKVTDKIFMFTSWRGCGARDRARFTVNAKNVQGKDVQFYVCTGFLKGSTIRTM
jgi:hypothetical protein